MEDEERKEELKREKKAEEDNNLLNDGNETERVGDIELARVCNPSVVNNGV